MVTLTSTLAMVSSSTSWLAMDAALHTLPLSRVSRMWILTLKALERKFDEIGGRFPVTCGWVHYLQLLHFLNKRTVGGVDMRGNARNGGADTSRAVQFEIFELQCFHHVKGNFVGS